MENNSKCKKTKNISLTERLGKFPFSDSKEIKIISFKNKIDNNLVGHELINQIDSIKLNKDIFQPEMYDEVSTLNPKQIEKLTDIIYNYTYKKIPYAIEDIKCYMPRNAIFFINGNNKIIAYIEICFGCNHIRSSDKNLDLGEYCAEKYDLIKSIFKEAKIEYGITKLE
ncbi:hypothetical protein [Flavobacterium sp. 3HN19-14]|uniref:hypothetical protein n=1 Tax=Flavobacterium sp. 3HN19-14 TaxID=3448133 RepID=UPI003EE16630